jgi:hypothetical protein
MTGHPSKLRGARGDTGRPYHVPLGCKAPDKESKDNPNCYKPVGPPPWGTADLGYPTHRTPLFHGL